MNIYHCTYHVKKNNQTNYYMASKELKFIHITKTGGTCVEEAGHKYGITWGKFHTEYGRWHTFFCMKPNKIKKKYNWFTIVRNPYTRILSEYYCQYGGIGNKNITHTKETMNSFLIDKILNRHITAPVGGHYSEQFKYIENVGNIKIHIIKFESFVDDLHDLLKTYDLPPIEFEKTNNRESLNKNVNFTVEDFSNDLITLINDVYDRDFELFGYNKMNIK